MLLRYNASLDIRQLFFEYGFVLGHRFDCSTKLLAPYYLGFDCRTTNLYFKFNELVLSLYTIRNFLVEVGRNVYRNSLEYFRRQSLFTFILVFSDRIFAAAFAFIFFTLTKKFGKSNYKGMKRYIDLGLFRFYVIARPTEGFITNCASICNDPGPIKWKGMPNSIDYEKTIFLSFGDYTLLNVVKSARANVNSVVVGVTDSNQFRTLDYFDYPVAANDQSFKLFSFIIIFFLKALFRQTYVK